ncbi:hypothetical protein [[Clostridium] colinum]|uniref:hypothetical protein n=1 Tax=[Clostridium] colinum TaxID=36835 RepID=UPI0020259F54|nr:hypothetical protein [[Clostridium] colinum]
MKFSNKKELEKFLKEPLELKKKLDKKQREFEVKNGDITINSGISNGIKSSNISKKVEDNVIELITLEEEIDILKSIFAGTIHSVNDFIENANLKEIEKRILRFKYIDFLSFEEIAYIEGYSTRAVYKYHKKSFLKMFS